MNIKQRVYEPINFDKVIYVEDGVTYLNNLFTGVRFRLMQGDEVYVSRDVYKIKLMECIPNTSLMCIRLYKRDKWWQFWKPRYKGAIYRMITN